jgi:hypothetical protein
MPVRICIGRAMGFREEPTYQPAVESFLNEKNEGDRRFIG